MSGLEYNLGKSIQVLFVDDEKTQIELAKLNLEKIDTAIQVTGAQTIAEAMSLLKSIKPDCVVSDYLMPEMNGIQLYLTIKDFGVPYILYTARGSDEIAGAAFSVGVDDYVRKEANLAHYDFLAGRIRHAVDRKRSEIWYRAYLTKA
jgi:CheY-like chemotaxis protein